MRKVELVDLVASGAGITKAEAGKAFDLVIKGITDALASGDKVTLPGFGVFSVGDRAARVGQNPQTGEKIQIPAAKVPKFKAGKSLKDSVQ